MTTPQQAASKPATFQSIPVVSLRDFSDGSPATRADFIQAVGDALQDIGFFALTDHGVDRGLIRAAYAEAERFFELGLDQKLAYEDLALRGQRGYTSYGREHARDSGAPDMKEFWHVGREHDDDPRSNGLPYRNLWPTELAEFKACLWGLYSQLDVCAGQLLAACSAYVGEPETRMPEATAYGDTILRVIHYPPVPADRHPQSVRAAAHEDINLITLLCEATTSGLELLQRDGRWRPIHAIEGQIIVDSGDMLQQWTNGVFKSTTHRVVNPDNSRERRFSMPFFVHPRPEVDLTPLPGCVARTGGTARFPSLTAGQYLGQRLKEIGLAS
jgi:isopenicillin N synthase-like dioxygenase